MPEGGDEMMHPVREVRVASTHAHPVEGSCLFGLADDGLVRVMTANGHGFRVVLADLIRAVEAIKAEDSARPK